MSLLLLILVALIAAVRPTSAAPVAGFKVLHSFSGTDGGSPNSLIQTADGFLYGSAANGGDVTGLCGSDGCGVLFRSDSAGSVTILHTFHATDGYLPTGLIMGSDGNFYGTTASGGQPSGGGAGIIFRIDATGNFTTLYAFVGGFACCDGGRLKKMRARALSAGARVSAPKTHIGAQAGTENPIER